MGKSMASQKRKKRKRSSDTKTPIIPVSSTSKLIKNARTRCSMDFQETRIATGVRNVVSRTRNKLIPSTPTW